MKHVDVLYYRDNYLKEVEKHLMDRKNEIPHFTSHNLHEAIMEEMNRADEETWEIEIPDDMDKAVHEAEVRIIETLKHNVDMGIGKSF